MRVGRRAGNVGVMLAAWELLRPGGYLVFGTTSDVWAESPSVPDQLVRAAGGRVLWDASGHLVVRKGGVHKGGSTDAPQLWEPPAVFGV